MVNKSMTIEHYLKQFAAIRTDTNRKRWSEITGHHAPHKPFLLLSILDLIGSGLITENFIEPSFELAETFANYWQKIMPTGSSGSMSYPFYHLASSPFWNLLPQPGISHRTGLAINTVKRLRKLYLGSRFAEDLWPLLLVEENRKQFRARLITTFFSPAVHALLLQQSAIHHGATSYCLDLLKTNETNAAYVTLQAQETETTRAIRDQGFRKAVVGLYQHRCAICGIRMLTPEGHTIVEAAHIIPWSTSHDDMPQNGIALCKLCHWSFDEGLMSVGSEYEVLVSPAVRQDNNFPGHMEMLMERPIFKPQESSFWPGQHNFAYHRKEVFRRR